MVDLPNNLAPYMTPWRSAAIQPYSSRNLTGECLEPVSGVALENLPWATAPRIEDAGPDDNIVCVKRSRTRCVLSLTIGGPEGIGVRVFAKRCLARNWGKELIGRWRSSKCHREWDLGWKLLQRQVLTGVPLAWAEKRTRRGVSENYLLTLGVPDSISFNMLMRRLPVEKDREVWMRILGGYIRILHDKGFVHDDLSTHHILISTIPPGSVGAPLIHLIDLDQSRFSRSVSALRRAHNFFQVFRSLPSECNRPRDRALFYLAYSNNKWTDEHIRAFEHAVSLIRLVKEHSWLWRPGKWLGKRASSAL